MLNSSEKQIQLFSSKEVSQNLLENILFCLLAKPSLHSYLKIDAGDFQYWGMLWIVPSSSFFSLSSFSNICSSRWKRLSWDQQASIISPPILPQCSSSTSACFPRDPISRLPFHLTPTPHHMQCMPVSVRVLVSVYLSLLTQRRHGKCKYFTAKNPLTKYFKCKGCSLNGLLLKNTSNVHPALCSMWHVKRKT